MKKLTLYVFLSLLLHINLSSAQQPMLFQDNMDGTNDVAGLINRGYLVYNRSSGSSGITPIWFQGNAFSFSSYNGPDSGYLAANYDCVLNIETINNWLVLPELNLSVDDTLAFYSRALTGSLYPDSIRVMYSAAGDSTPEGLSWVELGRFVVNTNGSWERKSFPIPVAGIHGRLAIRYAVADAGPLGLNSEFIGIDEIEVLDGNANVITGKVFIDQNGNGAYDTGETKVANQKIVELNSGRFGFSQASGDYNVAVLDSGNYEVTPVGLNYYSAAPASYTIYFNGIMQTDSSNDFALTPLGSFNDLCVTLTPMGNIRAGFDVSYMVNYSNIGTTTLVPTVTFIPDINLSFVTASISPLVIVNDTLYWNLLLLLHINQEVY